MDNILIIIAITFLSGALLSGCVVVLTESGWRKKFILDINQKFKYEQHMIGMQMNQNIRKYNILKKIYKLIPDIKIIGIGQNKRNEDLIVAINKETLYLFGERYQIHGNLPRIYFKIYGGDNCYSEKKQMKIIDVFMEDNNIGNGSVAINALIKMEKEIDCTRITGMLSFVDDDHADRRDHFYQKFGFEIVDSTIILEL